MSEEVVPAIRLVRCSAQEAQFPASELPGGVPRERLLVVCAEPDDGPALPLMAVEPASRQAWMLDGGTRSLVEASLPPMRPGSLAFAALLGVGAFWWEPSGLAALAYAGHRGMARALRRHRVQREIETALRRWLAEDPPGSAEAPGYRSVRSFQISGNSTTSSIFRR